MTQTSTPQPSTLPPLDYAAPGAAVSGRITILRWINLFGTFIAFLAIYGFFCILTPRTFLNVGTIEAIARQTTIVGIASMGMTLIVILGGIDLSAGSIVAFTCVVVAAVVAGGRYDLDFVLFHLRFSLP